jgi:glutamate-1-semialdehyde 2,1-aminomutase
VCGYHGWQDWFIGSTSRNKGVPKKTSALTLTFKYNDIKSLEKIFSKHPKGIAAVILEPMTNEFPENRFLEKTQKLCQKYGAILIFDETITGFRFSKGGAQEVFQITPDLSTFGKGIANGYPLSVVCGKREIMKEMENIFFSGTFGGELLSLAAANVVLGMHQRDQISPRLNEYGEELSRCLQTAINQTDMNSSLEIKGHPTWKFLEWKEGGEFTAPELKTFFMQEIFRSEILILSTHNVTLAHDKKIRGVIISKYEKVLAFMKKAISEGNLKDKLEVTPLKPLFKVR